MEVLAYWVVHPPATRAAFWWMLPTTGRPTILGPHLRQRPYRPRALLVLLVCVQVPVCWAVLRAVPPLNWQIKHQNFYWPPRRCHSIPARHHPTRRRPLLHQVAAVLHLLIVLCHRHLHCIYLLLKRFVSTCTSRWTHNNNNNKNTKMCRLTVCVSLTPPASPETTNNN